MRQKHLQLLEVEQAKKELARKMSEAVNAEKIAEAALMKIKDENAKQVKEWMEQVK